MTSKSFNVKVSRSYANSPANAVVSGKSQLSYFKALQNEHREVKQLHSRFPRPLKNAVLQSVHFQVEGKLETLADKVFERFHNRFFDDESESRLQNVLTE